MPAMHSDGDTIVAIATPLAAGGVGIVRVSGPAAHAIGATITGAAMQARRARHATFLDEDGSVIDDGLVLAFAAPASFTGEDVVELQAHGSPPVLRQLVQLAIAHGARAARAGEFSERAFLNGKLDLAQAEAVADLIAAGDLRAARAARRSLEGVFSQQVEAIAAELLAIRVHVEAAIDFADESLDTLGGVRLRQRLDTAIALLDSLLADAERGRKLRDGWHAVIVGPPNAGKSSLLNALAGSDRAIVTDIAGTTRDLLQETVSIDGVELTLVDTAGLREAGDQIELEGMRRARSELTRADFAIVVLDARDPASGRALVAEAISAVADVIWLHNKIDLLPPGMSLPLPADALAVSARTGRGLDLLRQRLRTRWESPDSDGAGAFSARARHVDALRRAALAAVSARQALGTETLELGAEALRDAHDALGSITGRVAPDAMLGHIFSTFCIGK